MCRNKKYRLVVFFHSVMEGINSAAHICSYKLMSFFFLLVLESLPEKWFDTDVPVWCRVNNKRFWRQTPNDLLYICCSISRTVCALLYAGLFSKMCHICFRVQKMWSSDLVSAQKKEKLWSNKPHFFFPPRNTPWWRTHKSSELWQIIKDWIFNFFSPSLPPTPKRRKKVTDRLLGICLLFVLPRNPT